MVKHSLFFKVYVYAVVVFLLSVPLTMAFGRAFRDQGRRESIETFLGPQLIFVQREVERSIDASGPSPARLAELGQAIRHRIRYVPWGDTGGYPQALKSQPMVLAEGPPEPGLHHWVRVEHGGKPVGALEITPNFGRPHHLPGRRIPHLAWLWALLLVGLVTPPIWLWVLRPIREMVAVARRLGAGDLDTPVPHARRDEFGELEQAFETMRGELRRALAQRERLLTDVSHELRGPLARMTLALPLLRREGASGPITELFEHEIKAADTLLSDVLAIARGRSGMKPACEPMDLAELVAPLVAEREIVVSQRGMRLTVRAEAARAIGHRALLARAMGNLLDNALKYTPEGGQIALVTETRGDRAIFRVEDDGPGIAPEHLPHLFQPFYRPDDSRSRETGGTGLGLAIVKDIAEQLNGTVSLQSERGHGTVAELSLPRSPGPP